MPIGTCVLCGERATTVEANFSTFLDLPGHSEARVRRCCSCDMLFLDPYPNPEKLEQLYSEAYFEVDNAAGLTGSGSHVDYAHVVRQRMAKFQATVELLARFVPAPARLMDVGAATGEFLDVARRAGYQVSGVELSSFAAEKAREQFGFDLFVGPLEAYETETRFDVVHLSHVMEHLVEPHRSIEKLDELLSERGVIYIEVPFQWNWAEQIHHRLGHRQRFTAFSVHHRSFFRPATLRDLFLRHGFECRHLTLTPPHRYPASTVGQHARRAVWRALSLAGQGLVIEAVFSRVKPSGGPGISASSG